MHFIKQLPVKYKLFLAYGILSIAIFCASFALLFYQARNSLEQRIKSELSRSNQTIADMVETAATVSIKNHLRAIAEKNREILYHLYRQYQNRVLTEADARRRAVDILLSQTVGETGYIYCINSAGIAVVHPNAGVRGNDFSARQFIQEQIHRKEGYLEYDWKNPGETEARPKALYMTYFEPWDWIVSVSSYKSEFTKLISVKDFRDRILDLTFGETGYSFILDTKGNIIIHPEISGNFFDIQDTRGISFVKEMIARKRGYLTYYWKNPSEKEDREKFVAFNYIPEFDWIVASSSYTQEVYAPLNEIKTRFLWILFLFIVVTGVVTLVVSASITKPLSELVKVFEKGARTAWATQTDENRKDEFGRFSASLNRFMGELEAYRKELIQEIGVRKEAEKELSILRRYLENIINSMPSMLIGLDRQGRVTLWNQKTEAATGVMMSDAYGKSFAEVLPRLAGLVEKASSEDTRGIKSITKSLHIADSGEERYENITVYPLTEEGFEGAVIRVDDVTENVRLEEMLIQNEKMLSVGGLAAGMAHEINNPLAGMLQTASLMQSRLGDLDLPVNRRVAEEVGVSMKDIRVFMERRSIFKMLDAISISGKRMAAIVENMLSFARKGDASFVQHRPDQLIDQALALAATDYDLKKHHDFRTIHIQKNYAASLPLVPCEKAKIQQVILNILRNGAQAMQAHVFKAGSEPCFSISLSVDDASEMLKIEIGDNGPGMDKETQRRIFEPFFSTKSPGDGTGLGLSISYFIITENHGGTMDVVSEPDKGTTFIIRLPLQHQAGRDGEAIIKKKI